MTTEDGLEQEMELTPDSLTSESLEAEKVVSPASLELASDSMEMMTEDGVEQEMEMVPDSITSESLEAEKVVSSVSLELASEMLSRTAKTCARTSSYEGKRNPCKQHRPRAQCHAK